MDPIRPLPPNPGPTSVGDSRPVSGARHETGSRFEVDRQSATEGVAASREVARPENADLDRVQARITEAATRIDDPRGIMDAVVRAELESQFGGALTGPRLDEAVERMLEDPGMRELFQRLLSSQSRGGAS